MSTWANAMLAAAVAVGTAASGYALAGSRDAHVHALGPEPVTVVIEAELSTFEPSRLRVVAGTTVRFVLVNRDPIHHELIVGPDDVHDRHRHGTEAWHPPVPGEVSVEPLGRGVTTYTFEQPGTLEMACHLPGHYDYGMHGEVLVVANPDDQPPDRRARAPRDS